MIELLSASTQTRLLSRKRSPIRLMRAAPLISSRHSRLMKQIKQMLAAESLNTGFHLPNQDSLLSGKGALPLERPELIFIIRLRETAHDGQPEECQVEERYQI